MLPDENGLAAWLRYAALPDHLQRSYTGPKAIYSLENDSKNPVHVAGQELQQGLNGILGCRVEVKHGLPPTGTDGIIVATVDAYSSQVETISGIPKIEEDGFWLHVDGKVVKIIGQNSRGVLYGAFELLSRLARGDFSDIDHVYNPSAPIRWADDWDNLDGSIERGYGGRSIFFHDMKVKEDLSRVAQYARLMASVRLNGCVVNNVNSHPTLLSPENMKGLARIADAMRPFGVRIGVSLRFDSPQALGGLSTSDPLDSPVISWWQDITAQLYEHVPDLLGYTIKANSEGQPGPLSYGRTLADGANLFARALKPFGDGLVMYRAFVYDHHLDESDWKNDRANAAVDFFRDLDGQFEENVVVQIKFGPIDFQVREPPSPLFAHLRKTSATIELMVAQEYFGQQSHLVYQAPLWKTILDFDLQVDDEPSVVRDIVSGQRFNRRNNGYVAVVNIGDDETWLGSHTAMLNLYAYGNLAWDPQRDSEEMAREWTQLTFGLHDTVVETITRMCMESWPMYEQYSGNLGIQTLCDILGIHFGPGPWNMDGNGWGQWTRATKTSIGVDRTVATGSGNAGQYPPKVASVFESLEATPDDLLLWFHHVPYTHRLKSGKTVIQHFYDEHYAGAAAAQQLPVKWETLKGLIDDRRHAHVSRRLTFQAGHALVWRDMICNFYHHKCEVPDTAGRVGSHPWRYHADALELDGYDVLPVDPPEKASGGKVLVTTASNAPGTAQVRLDVPDGTYAIAVNYYDHLGGKSTYKLLLNDGEIGKWHGNLEDDLGHDFSEFIDGHSETRRTFRAIKVRRGDVVKVIGYPDGSEKAPLDYIAVLPPGVVD